jgi:hypothetical protein
MAMDQSTRVPGNLEDLEFLKKKLPHYAERYSKLGFFYLNPEDAILENHKEALKLLFEAKFRGSAITEKGCFLGVHAPFEVFDYRRLGKDLRDYFGRVNINVGTASLVSGEGDYAVVAKSLDDLAALSIKDRTHKHTE